MSETAATTQSPAHSAQQHADALSPHAKKIALITVAMAFIMDLLDTTIVNIAIPSIQADLGATYSTIQWLIAGYSLTFAVLLITGGRMGDVYGYKKLFIIGVAGFTFASLLCGLAWNSEVLILARLIQGAMAALMVPQVMSMMQILFQPHERGHVMGIFGAMAGVAATAGPIIGGILIHFNIAGLEWRPIFLINVPVGIISLIMAKRYLPEGKSPHPLKLDIIGTILIIIALGLLVFPLIEGRELDWPAWTFVMMAASIPVLFVFGWWQGVKDRKDQSALIVPALLKTKTFVKGLIINITFEAAMLGFFLPFTLILQVGLGYEIIKAALAGIPTAIGISVTMAVFSQKLIPKLGRYALTLGTVLMSIGLIILYLTIHHAGLDTTPWEMIPGLLFVGSGMAMIMAPIFAVVLTDVDAKHAGSASGVLNAVQQLGGAIGVALIGLFFFGALTHHAPASFQSVVPQIQSQLTALNIRPETQEQIIASSQTCYVDLSKQKDNSELPESCKQFNPSPAASKEAGTAPKQSAAQIKVGLILKQNIKQANANNFINAFRVAVIFELVILAIVFVLSFSLPRHIRPEAYEQAA